MAKISISKAAKLGYASRPTLYRDVKSGKLSAETDGKGRTTLDPSELVRVYGDPTSNKAEPVPTPTVEDAVEKAVLRERLTSLEAQLDAAKAETATLKEAMKLIEHQSGKADTERDKRLDELKAQLDAEKKRAEAAEERASKGVLRRLFGA